MDVFLAIDAGGTKTDYALADETQVLARTRSGTIKRLRADATTAAENLDTALAALAAQSGVSMQSVTRTCIGAAGEKVPLVTDWLRSEIAARVSGELLLVGDVEIALDAAFHGGPGVLVLAGTGSNVAARLHSGELTTAGGWGPALAEQGSGYKIGREGLRAVFLAMDARKPTQLTQAILNQWSIASIALLVEHANATPAPDVSTLASVVLECAQSGDAVAQHVLQSEGESLGYLVRLVLRRFTATGGDVPSMAFAGSIMEHFAPVRAALVADVRREFPTAQILNGVVDPIDGALWRARGGR